MRIVFAGGGTGGHLFPGLALAQALLGSSQFQVRSSPSATDGARPALNVERRTGNAAFFLCTERPFDHEQLSLHSMPHTVLPAPRLGQKRFALKMTDAVRSAATCLRVFHPDVVVGLGGYGSGPAILAAMLYGVPVALLEQNVVPGKANRVAARASRRIYAQWAESKAHFDGAGSRFRFTGSPLRSGMSRVDRATAVRAFGLDPARRVVTVIGGSQGAESLNKLVLREAAKLNGARTGLQVLHLAGPGAPEAEGAWKRLGVDAVVRPFVREMDRVYSASDLVVSRAGAMAIAEMAHFGVPSVLVPYPQAAENHQMENARVLERQGAAWLIDEKDHEPGALASLLSKVGEPQFEERRRRLSRFAKPDAAAAILEDMKAWA